MGMRHRMSEVNLFLQLEVRPVPCLKMRSPHFCETTQNLIHFRQRDHVHHDITTTPSMASCANRGGGGRGPHGLWRAAAAESV